MSKHKHQHPLPGRTVIQTTLGDGVFDPSLRFDIPVDNARGVYMVKPARDVQPGDKVAFRNQWIAKSFPEVQEALMQDPLYHLSRETLFEQNGSVWVPRFAISLHQGLAAHDALPAGLEQVLLSGNPLSSEELSSGVGCLKEVLDHREPTFLSWLRGETIAPEDWKEFQALERIEPSFAHWRKESGNPLYEAYALYVAANRVVTGFLHKRTGLRLGAELRGSDSAPDAAKRRSFHDQIHCVVSQFADFVTDDVSYATVLHVRNEPAKGASHAHHEAGNGSLHHGILQHIPEDKRRSTLGMQELVDHFDATHDLYFQLAGEFLRLLRQSMHSSSFHALPKDLQFMATMWAYGKISSDNGTESSIGDFLRYVGKPPAQQMEIARAGSKALSESFVRLNASGDLDTSFKLPAGTFRRLESTVAKLRRMVPSDYWTLDNMKRISAYNAVTGEPVSSVDIPSEVLQSHGLPATREGRREFARRREKLEERLRKTYGFDYGKKREFAVVVGTDPAPYVQYMTHVLDSYGVEIPASLCRKVIMPIMERNKLLLHDVK